MDHERAKDLLMNEKQYILYLLIHVYLESRSSSSLSSHPLTPTMDWRGDVMKYQNQSLPLFSVPSNMHKYRNTTSCQFFSVTSPGFSVPSSSRFTLNSSLMENLETGFIPSQASFCCFIMDESSSWLFAYVYLPKMERWRGHMHYEVGLLHLEILYLVYTEC